MTRAELDLLSYSAKLQEKIDALIAQNAQLTKQNEELKAELISMTERMTGYMWEGIEQTELKNRVEDAVQTCLKNITKAFSNAAGGKKRG